MAGIIHSIMRFVEACLGSVLGAIVTFCCAQVDTPTRMGKIKYGAGLARSSHRKLLFMGATVSATGFQEYSLRESPIRSSGLVPKALSRA